MRRMLNWCRDHPPSLFFEVKPGTRVNLRGSEDESGKKHADGDNRDVPGTIQPTGKKKDLMEMVGQQLSAVSWRCGEARTADRSNARKKQ